MTSINEVRSSFFSLKIVRDHFEGLPAVTLFMRNKKEYVRKKLL